MSNETKRDVFVKLAEDVKITDSFDEEYPKSQEYIEKKYKENIHNYDNALPDDMPVIPEAVGEYIIEAKAGHYGIGFVLMIGGRVMTSNRIAFEEWLTRANSYSDRIDRENTFARAWLDGVWRVDETGEIVKLEEEK